MKPEGEQVDPYAYLDLYNIHTFGIPEPGHLRNANVRDVTEIFRANIDRLLALIAHSPLLMMTTSLHEQIAIETNILICGEPFADYRALHSRGVLLNDWRKKYTELIEDKRKKRQLSGSVMGETLTGVWYLSRVINTEPSQSYLRIGISVILSTMLLAAWTAFESLVGDLRAKAVNMRPNSLGKKVITIADNDKDEEGRPQPITPKRYMEWSLQNKMRVDDKLGNLMRRERRSAFNRLEGLQSYYRLTFGPKAEDIFKAHPDLAVLEAFRNVIAHQGGRVDEFFHEKVAHVPELYAIEIGKELIFDGSLVSHYSMDAIMCGSELIRFVDQWLSDHPE